MGELWRKIVRTEGMTQRLLPDDFPSRSWAAEPKTANKNGGSCQAMYSEIYSSSRFHKFIQAQADLFTIWQPWAVQSSSVAG